MLELASRPLYFDCWMRSILFEFSRAAANQAQLGIGIKAAVFNPAAKKKIFARDVETDCASSRLYCIQDFLNEFWLQCFIGIQLQNPVARPLFHRGIVLRCNTFPWLNELLRAE